MTTMLRQSILLLTFVAILTVTATAPEKLRLPTRPSIEDANFCQGCRSVVSFVQPFNVAVNRTLYKDLFDKFCELYYPVSTDFQQGPCPLFVEGLYYALDHLDPIHHCDQIGACNGPKETRNSKPNWLGASVACDFCLQLVQQTQEALSDPKAIVKVVEEANAFCDYLQVMGQDKACQQLVQQYLSQAIEFVQKMKPLDYCRSIKLCSLTTTSSAYGNGGEQSVDRTVISTNSPLQSRRKLPHLKLHPIDLSTALEPMQRNSIQSTLSVQSGPMCMICQQIVKLLFQYIDANTTVADIEYALNILCEEIYTEAESIHECKTTAAQYSKQIYQVLVIAFDPQYVCMLFGQCWSKVDSAEVVPPQLPAISTESLDLHGLLMVLDPPSRNSRPNLGSFGTCLECKLFVKYLRTTFGNAISQRHLRNWLIVNLCDELPEPDLVNSCSELVTTQSGAFFSALAENLDPKRICFKFGACRRPQTSILMENQFRVLLQPKRSLEMVPKEKEFKGLICDQCVSIVGQIDEYLASQPIEDDVSVLIKEVCDHMTDGALRTECVALVQRFGSQITQAIATMDNPRQLCSKVLLCQKQN